MTPGTAVAKKKAGKRVESRKYGTLVRLADDVVADAKILASMRDISMAELLSETLRSVLKKALEAEYRKRLEKGDQD